MVSIILLFGGTGQRFQGSVTKQYFLVNGN